jgi:hypothetical protein
MFENRLIHLRKASNYEGAKDNYQDAEQGQKDKIRSLEKREGTLADQLRAKLTGLSDPAYLAQVRAKEERATSPSLSERALQALPKELQDAYQEWTDNDPGMRRTGEIAKLLGVRVNGFGDLGKITEAFNAKLEANKGAIVEARMEEIRTSAREKNQEEIDAAWTELDSFEEALVIATDELRAVIAQILGQEAADQWHSKDTSFDDLEGQILELARERIAEARRKHNEGIETKIADKKANIDGLTESLDALEAVHDEALSKYNAKKETLDERVASLEAAGKDKEEYHRSKTFRAIVESDHKEEIEEEAMSSMDQEILDAYNAWKENDSMSNTAAVAKALGVSLKDVDFGKISGTITEAFNSKLRQAETGILDAIVAGEGAKLLDRHEANLAKAKSSGELSLEGHRAEAEALASIRAKYQLIQAAEEAGVAALQSRVDNSNPLRDFADEAAYARQLRTKDVGTGEEGPDLIASAE